MSKKLKIKLIPEIKKAWIEALRSDEYIQGKGKLIEKKVSYERVFFKYCCLGVVSKINSAQVKNDSQFKYRIGRISHIESSYPPVSWFRNLIIGGHKISDAKISKLLDKLVNMNDDRNYSFKSISNYIEKWL